VHSVIYLERNFLALTRKAFSTAVEKICADRFSGKKVNKIVRRVARKNCKEHSRKRKKRRKAKRIMQG
jgi:hypothetical protein